MDAVADVNAVDEDGETALCKVHQSVISDERRNSVVSITLQLICCGAKIDDEACEMDTTNLLRPIKDRLNLLRRGIRMKNLSMTNTEGCFIGK